MVRALKFFLFCVVAIFVAGCSSGPDKGEVAQLAAQCTSSEIGVRIDPDDITITNSFTRTIDGETVYYYDFSYDIRKPDGTLDRTKLTRPLFNHRIAIVVNGNQLEGQLVD